MHRNPLDSCTLTMKNQREINETIPFTIVTKIIRFLGINLPKEAKDLYSENYKREAWRAAIHGVAKSRTRLSE